MGKIIVLDPGHGLNEQGEYSRPLMDCRNNKAIQVPRGMKPHEDDNSPGFYREDFGTLKIANYTASELRSMGHQVFMTREDNRNAGLYLSSLSNNEWKKQYWKSWRWIKDLTESTKADLFVSIHTNAGGGSGCSAFWAEPIGEKLCYSILESIRDSLNIKIRRVAKHRYLILRDTCGGRTCLIECLFHDNIDEIKLLLKEEGYIKLSKAIAQGIDNYSNMF